MMIKKHTIKQPADNDLIDANLNQSAAGLNKRNNDPIATDTAKVADIESSQDAKPHKSNYSLCDALANAIFTSVLGEILLIIPLGIVAWVFITWGVMWLFIPLIIIMLIVIKVIYSRYTRKP